VATRPGTLVGSVRRRSLVQAGRSQPGGDQLAIHLVGELLLVLTVCRTCFVDRCEVDARLLETAVPRLRPCGPVADDAVAKGRLAELMAEVAAYCARRRRLTGHERVSRAVGRVGGTHQLVEPPVTGVVYPLDVHVGVVGEFDLVARVGDLDANGRRRRRTLFVDHPTDCRHGGDVADQQLPLRVCGPVVPAAHGRHADRITRKSPPRPSGREAHVVTDDVDRELARVRVEAAYGVPPRPLIVEGVVFAWEVDLTGLRVSDHQQQRLVGYTAAVPLRHRGGVEHDPPQVRRQLLASNERRSRVRELPGHPAIPPVTGTPGSAVRSLRIRLWCRPMGTTIGVPDTGSETTWDGMPKIDSTDSSVTTAAGSPSPRMAPSFMASRWSAYRAARLRSCSTMTM